MAHFSHDWYYVTIFNHNTYNINIYGFRIKYMHTLFKQCGLWNGFFLYCNVQINSILIHVPDHLISYNYISCHQLSVSMFWRCSDIDKVLSRIDLGVDGVLDLLWTGRLDNKNSRVSYHLCIIVAHYYKFWWDYFKQFPCDLEDNTDLLQFSSNCIYVMKLLVLRYC